MWEKESTDDMAGHELTIVEAWEWAYGIHYTYSTFVCLKFS
jgi:hypothetical protein